MIPRISSLSPVHGLHGHIKPPFFSFFPFSSPLTFMFQWEPLYWFVHSLHFSWSDPSSFSFFSLITGFPTAKTNKLFYTQILPNPDFPKANTITQSGDKCSFSGKRLCFCRPSVYLPLAQQGPQSPGNVVSISLLQCHLAQREHTPTQLFWIHSLSWIYITLCLKKRFWNVCFTSGIHPKLSCLSLVSKPSLGSVFSRAEIVLPWKGVLGVQPTTQDTPECCKVSAILFTPFTNLHSVYLTVG